MSPQEDLIGASAGMVRGDLGSGLAQPLRLGRQRMAVEFCGGNRQIAEIGTRLRMEFVVIIEGSLHDDRLKGRP